MPPPLLSLARPAIISIPYDLQFACVNILISYRIILEGAYSGKIIAMSKSLMATGPRIVCHPLVAVITLGQQALELLVAQVCGGPHKHPPPGWPHTATAVNRKRIAIIVTVIPIFFIISPLCLCCEMIGVLTADNEHGEST